MKRIRTFRGDKRELEIQHLIYRRMHPFICMKTALNLAHTSLMSPLAKYSSTIEATYIVVVRKSSNGSS